MAKIKHKLLSRVLPYVKADNEVLLIGPAGVGKTELAKQIAEELGLTFYSAAFNEQSTNFDLLGGVSPLDKDMFIEKPFYTAFTKGGLWLLDEMDAANPSVLTVLNMALANREYPFANSSVPIKAHKDFRVIACSNTDGLGNNSEYTSRQKLDKATLDRFQTKFEMELDEGFEEKLFGDKFARLTRVAREFGEDLEPKVELSTLSIVPLGEHGRHATHPWSVFPRVCVRLTARRYP